MKIYHDNWEDWSDVSSDFSGTYTKPKTPAIKEPEEVIFAGYSYEDYSGSAFVLFREGDRYYTVSGGHCSCYGLEGQWEPEEYFSLWLLIAALEKYDDYGVFKHLKGEILTNLKARGLIKEATC